MAKGDIAYDPVTGERFVENETGDYIPAPEASLRAQAGRQFADLGFYGGVGIDGGLQRIVGDAETERRIDQESRERNQAFAGTDLADPIKSFVGQNIPGLATLPLSAGSYLGTLGLNMALAGAESGLDVGSGGDATERLVTGAAGGALGTFGGDMVSRLAGRVTRGISGLLQDIGQARPYAANPAARAWEDLGGETTAAQRMAQGTRAQEEMLSLEKGLEASRFGGRQQELFDNQQDIVQGAVLDAVGLGRAQFGDLGPDTLLAANTRISDGFSANARAVEQAGPLNIGTDLAQQISRRGQIPELQDLGRFKGLTGDSPTLQGQEWLTARAALAQDAAQAASKGRYEVADELFKKVDQLDAVIEPRLPPDQLAEFARLREQYRVLKNVMRPNIIKADGTLSARNLNTQLNRESGFGNTARFGLDTVNPESKALIETARAAADPSLQPFPSSGTAENLLGANYLADLANPARWPGLAADTGMAAAVKASSLGGGRGVAGLATPSGYGPIGMGIGRAALDQALFPFVGISNEAIDYQGN